MLAPLLLLQALQPPIPPRALVIAAPAPGAERAVTVERTVAVERLPAGSGGVERPAVRADLLATAVGGTLSEQGGGRWLLRAGALEVDLYESAPYVRVRSPGRSDAAPLTRAVPLADVPVRVGGRLWLPLQLATDVLPRTVSGWRYDPESGRLSTTAPPSAAIAASSTARAATGAVPSADAPPPAREPSRPAATRLPTIVGRRTDPPARRPAAPSPAQQETAERPAARPSVPPPSQAARDERRVVELAEAAPAIGSGSLRGRVVVVDAGHGGPDTGMEGPLGGGTRIQEKDVTLALARALRSTLASRGVSVVMTRTRDTLIALADRGRIANQAGGDLFVSIHVNAANPGWRNPAATRGFETYFLSEARTEDARRLAERENGSVRFETRSVAGRSDPLDFVLRDLAQNDHLRGSSRLAAIVQRRLDRAHPGPSRGVKQAGFRVLTSAFMPAVLVEVGYGTNPQEAAYLASADGQQRLAEAIAEAAVEYLRRYPRRARGSGGEP